MTNAIFITGTDTGVGKTLITGLLARSFAMKGVRVVTQKWIQTGSNGAPGDISTHMHFATNVKDSIKKYGSDMSPYVFDFPASPHLAARLEKKNINIKKIKDSFRRLSSKFDFVIIEGTGGLLVPVNGKTLMVDIVKSLEIPVLVVAENKLGAINHTLLTVEALRRRNLKIVGIVFNRLQKNGDKTVLKDNMRIIKKFTGENILGELLHNGDKQVLYAKFGHIGGQLLKVLNLYA